MLRLLLILTLALAACSAKIQGGNEHGAIVSFNGTSEAEAFRVAEEHCAQYGRTAKLVQVTAIGDDAVFDCVP